MPNLTPNQLIKAESSGARYSVSCPWNEVAQNSSPYLERDNRLINGEMKIAQRGTSFVSPSIAYTLDRWRYIASATTVAHTITQDSSVPTVAQTLAAYGVAKQFKYSYKADVTTADASVGSTDICVIRQVIEGSNIYDIIGAGYNNGFTMSFWVKDTKTGIHCVAFQNSGQDRSYVAEYTVNATDTWEYKTVTVTAVPSGGTWDSTNGAGLHVNFPLIAGSSFQTSAGAWQAGNFYGTSNIVNSCDNTANNFHVTGVQLQIGTFATPFEYRSIDIELAMCRRYYEKSAAMISAITDSSGNTFMITGTNSTTAIYLTVPYKVEKRGSAPTVQFYDNAGNAGKISTFTAALARTDNVTPTGGVPNGTYQNHFLVAHADAGSRAGFQLNWTSESEL